MEKIIRILCLIGNKMFIRPTERKHRVNAEELFFADANIVNHASLYQLHQGKSFDQLISPEPIMQQDIWIEGQIVRQMRELRA